MNDLYKTILHREGKIGAKIFGQAGAEERQFYCLDANTWIWRQGRTTVFYKVNPLSVYKSNDGVCYRLADREESKRLLKAAKVYRNLIESKVYDSLLALS